jgi:hypothetical protein
LQANRTPSVILKGHKAGDAYRGYHLRILTRQGKSAAMNAKSQPEMTPCQTSGSVITNSVRKGPAPRLWPGIA